MNPGEGHVVANGDVAGDVEATSNALEDELVGVDDFGRFGGDGAQASLERGILDNLLAGLDGGGLAFDVGKDRGDLGDFEADFVFERGHLVVRIFHGEALVHFEVLFDVERAFQILHADIVDVEIVAGGDGTNAVKQILAASGTRDGADHDVGIGKNAVHTIGDGFGNLFGALERNVASHAHEDIREIAIAGAADARAIDIHNAIDGGDGIKNLATDAAGRSVEQGVDGFSRQTPAHGDDDDCDEESGDGIGFLEPRDPVSFASPDEGQSKNHNGAGIDISREMEGVGFEGLTVVLLGNTT